MTLDETFENAAQMTAEPIDATRLCPWRRYFARMFDVCVFALSIGLVIGIAVPDLFILVWRISRIQDQWFSMAVFAAYVPFEAFCLSAFGSTLGKTLYGIKLTAPDGRIAFSRALIRSAKVWFRGFGLAFPVVSLFTLGAAYQRLGQNGRTSWDADANWSVVHSQLGVPRWIGILACWMAVILAFYALGDAKHL